MSTFLFVVGIFLLVFWWAELTNNGDKALPIFLSAVVMFILGSYL
jgi:hypothetical protein